MITMIAVHLAIVLDASCIIVTKISLEIQDRTDDRQLERGSVPSFAASFTGFQCCRALKSQQVRFAGMIVQPVPIASFAFTHTA